MAQTITLLLNTENDLKPGDVTDNLKALLKECIASSPRVIMRKDGDLCTFMGRYLGKVQTHDV